MYLALRLEKRDAQGDSLSRHEQYCVLQYLTAQIQIFNIEFSKNEDNLIPINNVFSPPPPICISSKNKRIGQTNKNESFADDSENPATLTLAHLAGFEVQMHEIFIVCF
jgi:hypothetical protein